MSNNNNNSIGGGYGYGNQLIGSQNANMVTTTSGVVSTTSFGPPFDTFPNVDRLLRVMASVYSVFGTGFRTISEGDGNNILNLLVDQYIAQIASKNLCKNTNAFREWAREQALRLKDQQVEIQQQQCAMGNGPPGSINFVPPYVQSMMVPLPAQAPSMYFPNPGVPNPSTPAATVPPPTAVTTMPPPPFMMMGPCYSSNPIGGMPPGGLNGAAYMPPPSPFQPFPSHANTSSPPMFSANVAPSFNNSFLSNGNVQNTMIVSQVQSDPQQPHIPQQLVTSQAVKQEVPSNPREDGPGPSIKPIAIPSSAVVPSTTNDPPPPVAVVSVPQSPITALPLNVSSANNFGGNTGCSSSNHQVISHQTTAADDDISSVSNPMYYTNVRYEEISSFKVSSPQRDFETAIRIFNAKWRCSENSSCRLRKSSKNIGRRYSTGAAQREYYCPCHPQKSSDVVTVRIADTGDVDPISQKYIFTVFGRRHAFEETKLHFVSTGLR